MKKSVRREYELDRSYDYAESIGFNNSKRNVSFVKRRARRRFRHKCKQEVNIYRIKSFNEI